LFQDTPDLTCTTISIYRFSQEFVWGKCEFVGQSQKIKITLRLAIYRQSVRLGAKSRETYDQFFFFLATESLRA
jgi:hypothetical protein